MFGSLGLPELLVIFLIVLVLFGANKLPQLGKGLGSAIRNFKEGMNEGRDGDRSSELASVGFSLSFQVLRVRFARPLFAAASFLFRTRL